MRRVIIIFFAAFCVAVGSLVLLTVALAVRKHLQTACYFDSVITSEAKAVEAAKDLIIKERIFNFPTSQDFVTSLEAKARCCGAKRYFSDIYLSNVWEVVLVSQDHFTFIDMDECGRRLFDHGSTGN